ncbi:MAG: glutaredoxin family protein [Chloroflexota bacterium]|nr:glutaredoxin family protein [Chloroflexota bacterium]
MDTPIRVYSGPLCSGCLEVKSYLTAHGLPFEERNIRRDMATMIEFRRKGYEILPVIELGSTVIREYESLEQLETALRAGGYL